MQELTKNQKRRMNHARLAFFYHSMHSLTKQQDIQNWLSVYLNILAKDSLVDMSAVCDILQDVFDALATSNFTKFERTVMKYLEKIDLYDFLIASRRAIAHYSALRTVSFFHIWIVNLVITLCIGHPVCGIDSKNGKIFVGEGTPTSCDIMLGAVLPEIKMKGYNLNKDFDPNDISFMHSMLQLQYGDSITITVQKYIEGIMQQNGKDYRDAGAQLVRHFVNSEVVNQVARLYDNIYRPYDPFEGAFWVREDFSKDQLLAKVYSYLMGTAFEQENLFKYRERLLREAGVQISFTKTEDDPEDLQCMNVREIHNFRTDEHYLVAFGTYVCGITRQIVIDLDNPVLADTLLLYEADYMLFITIMVWLGLKDKLTQHLDDETPKIQITKEQKQHLNAIYVGLFEDTQEQLTESGLRYEDPVSWNYTGTHKYFKTQSTASAHSPEFEYVVRSIGAYVRRLPEGYSASEEKLQLAKKYLIELKDGYTLVEGFLRRQRVKVNSEVDKIEAF